MSISCSWTHRATAIFGFLLLALVTACGSPAAGGTDSADINGEQPTPTLYDGTASTKTQARRPHGLDRNVAAPTSTSETTTAASAVPTVPTAPAPTAPPEPTPAPATPAAPTAPAAGTASTTSLRGTNLVGMEGGYSFNTANGPIPNTEYAVHSTSIVDYLAAKNINVIRLLFSWERMQSTLGGPIPAAASGNYKSYFDDFKRIVDYATNVKGMTAIIEPWQASSGGGVGGPSWRGNRVGNGVVTNAHFADFWSKMASIFANNPRAAIGLVNEPNAMSTMTWFSAAQAAITAIRATSFGGDILVPGNGWTGAGNWNDAGYDTASPQRSNAYGWLNARGPGLALLDPLGKLVVGVHTYADADASGSGTSVVSGTVTRDRVKVAVDWARANGLKVFVGEIGMYAGAANASANWASFVSYLGANADTLTGFAWWGCGKPGWWDDVAASGGGHFSITPSSNYTADTVNMTMIQSAFESTLTP